MCLVFHISAQLANIVARTVFFAIAICQFTGKAIQGQYYGCGKKSAPCFPQIDNHFEDLYNGLL